MREDNRKTAACRIRRESVCINSWQDVTCNLQNICNFLSKCVHVTPDLLHRRFKSTPFVC